MEFNLENYFETQYEERNNLQAVFQNLYRESRILIGNEQSHNNVIFWDIYTKINNERLLMYEAATFVLMSYYFKTCDIFEEPPSQTLF